MQRLHEPTRQQRWSEPNLQEERSGRLYELDRTNWHRRQLRPMRGPVEERLTISGEPDWSGDVAPRRPTLRYVESEWSDLIEEASTLPVLWTDPDHEYLVSLIVDGCE